MNNDNFASLVRERATASTRQIARDAVESEFKRKGKRQRRRGGADGYSSDEDDDDDTGRNGKQQKRKADKEEEEQESLGNALKYRDRAKERREGKADGSKVGDAIKQEQKPEPSLDDQLEQALRQGLNKQQAQPKDKGFRIPATKEEAEFKILNGHVQATSTLGRDLLAFYKAKLLVAAAAPDGEKSKVSNAGRIVQRTSLHFSAAKADPRNRAQAWLVPSEQVFAAHDNGDNDVTGGVIAKASPVTPAMLQSIQDVLSKQRIKQEQQQQQQQGEQQKTTRLAAATAEDDSEDDIFNDIGSDYEPTLVAQTKAHDATTNEKITSTTTDTEKQKTSIFGDETTRTQIARVDTTNNRLLDTEHITAAQTTRLVGFAATSSIDYGLGDDYDNDFDGRSEWDDGNDNDKLSGEPKSKRKKRKRHNAGADAGVHGEL